MSGSKTIRRLVGLGLIVILAGLVTLSIAAFNKAFTPVTMVTLYTDSSGNEMNLNANVTVNGVIVGSVRSISADGSGAELGLALDPASAAKLPANVTAILSSTTLFGERQVQLVMPKTPADQTLADVRVISQDRSADALEVEKVLGDLEPMLTAVQPEKLAVSLTAIAQALQGRGTQLGQTLVQLNAYLKQFDPYLPALDQDIRMLAQVSQTYSQAAPGILSALHDFSITSQTVATESGNLSSLYATVTAASQNLHSFVRSNQGSLIHLSLDSRATLQTLARYSSEFPCVLQGLTDFIPNMNKVLGAGSSQHGIHITVHPVQSLGPYKAGVNDPYYGDNIGPHCYSLPFRGISLNDGAGNPSPINVTSAGLGMPNSPGENELINELLSTTVNVPAQRLPSWSSVLLGPLYRGTEVIVK
jgi:phospholipid/cholesterol/gamma-HCH transport system substrate-binding protein